MSVVSPLVFLSNEIRLSKYRSFFISPQQLTVTSKRVALCSGQHWMRFRKACFASSMFIPIRDWWCMATCSFWRLTRSLGGRQWVITCRKKTIKFQIKKSELRNSFHKKRNRQGLQFRRCNENVTNESDQTFLILWPLWIAMWWGELIDNYFVLFM